MKLTKRAQSIKPSPTLAITAKANRMKAEGIEIPTRRKATMNAKKYFLFFIFFTSYKRFNFCFLIPDSNTIFSNCIPRICSKSSFATFKNY